MKFEAEKEALYRDVYADTVEPAPGIVDYIISLKNIGIKIAVGSSAPLENIDCDERYKHLPLTSVYSPEKYPKFDNIDAINVGKTKDIPRDYKGIMGVPITFIDWYNPNQFEIVGNEYTLNIAGGRGYVNGKRLYSRIFIRKV